MTLGGGRWLSGEVAETVGSLGGTCPEVRDIGFEPFGTIISGCVILLFAVWGRSASKFGGRPRDAI